MKKNRSTFSILFYLNTSKKKKSGRCPVVGRISVDGESTTFSTGLDILPGQWDAKAGLAIGKSEEIPGINRDIEKHKTRIAEYYKVLVNDNGYVTAESLKNAIRGIGTHQNTVMEEFLELLEEKRKSVGIRIAENTFTAYPNAHRHFKAFLQHKYHVGDIPFGKIDIALVDDYSRYLKTDLRMKARTERGYMAIFRHVVKRAFNKGLVRIDPFTNYTPPRLTVERRWLFHDELERLRRTDMEYPAWNFTRDMFVFSAFTGISYIDLKNLKQENIQRQEDGSLWIVLNRQKTGTTSYIPLLAPAINILNRYEGTEFAGECNCVYRLQTRVSVNLQLKKIAKKAGIEKRLTFHMSRFTYATTVCLTNGMPIETLSRMMGHLSIKTTQIYAEVTRTKINEDMTNLAERIQGKYELPEYQNYSNNQ